MDFALSWEQQQLKEAAAGFLDALPSARAVLEGRGSVEDPAVWRRIAQEQGWPAILVPEDDGGFGFGQVELAVVLEEVGRTLTSCPLLGTAFATAVILECGDGAQRARWLGAIAGGEPAAVAWSGIAAEEGPFGWSLDGSAVVVDGTLASILVVVTPQGPFVLAADLCERTRLDPLDPTRPLARVIVSGVSADRLAGDGLERARARCESFVASEAVGAAEAALELAVEYSRVRTQFGRPIGTFQAIQHMAADVLVAVESARSAAWYAAWAVDAGADDAREAARTAKAMACDALFLSAGQSLQIHGGVGFTWEHDCHLYFKRARAVMDLLGHPREHRAAIAQALLGDA
jgi:alkylation response protein AidB-like acyl-CoA dehydrogenase